MDQLTSNWGRPVLGYTGTIHSDRVDVDLIVALARAFPNGTIALVGPMLLPDSEHQKLLRCRNVVVTGAIPYADVPAMMCAFDICIAPHRVTPFTESLNPIKLWEYLAVGKPIVATPVAGFRDYPGLVYLGADAESFRAGIARALIEPSTLGEARRMEAAKNTWKIRVNYVEDIIEDVCATRQPRP